MKNTNELAEIRNTKKRYYKPKLKNLGKVAKLTFKMGSQTDFGTGKFSS